jgi:chromosome segregation ATPase
VISVTSTLDSRRDKASAAATAAEQAQAGVNELDHRLETNATLRTQQAQALRNAQAEAARLKRSLKAVAKEQDRLTAARKKAAARVDKAKAKQKAAEAKYDKVVLADLVRREKERDRTAAGDGPSEQGSRTTAEPPPPEQPSTATRTATRTAARRTARTAR